MDLVGDVDDMFYYAGKKLLITSGGDGYINIFEKDRNNHFKQVSNIVTGEGARTSLFIPSLGYFVLAVRANGGRPASIIVYQMNG